MSPATAPLAYSRLPSDLEGWVIWGLAALSCAWVLWKSVQWTFWPGEEEPDHVKRSILDDGPAAPHTPPSPPDGPPTPLVSSAAHECAAPEAHA